MTKKEVDASYKIMLSGIELETLESALEAAGIVNIKAEIIPIQLGFDWSVESLAVKGSFFVIEHLKTFRNEAMPGVRSQVVGRAFKRLVKPVSTSWEPLHEGWGDRNYGKRKPPVAFKPEDLGLVIRPRHEVNLENIDFALVPRRLPRQHRHAVQTESFVDFIAAYHSGETDPRFKMALGDTELLTGFSSTIKSQRSDRMMTPVAMDR